MNKLTLEEAIKRNKHIKSANVILTYDKTAIQLGIEALEFCQCQRLATENKWLLPSEKEETPSD